jgi:ATP-dependent Clp protease ATP-binding subunit ClpX
MTDQKQLACNFCGKYREDVEKLISGPDVYICNECITLSYKIIKEDKELEVNDFNLETLPKPDEINSFLDEHVIGQVFAKEILSVSAYNHYKRISQSAPDVDIEKTNILLVGSSGSGKTLLAKTLAKKLKVPFAIADATTLTEAGYVGEDVESVLERLLSLSNYDLSLAEKGIVFIDEVDKKARRSESSTSTRDVSGEGVQQALLRLIEGTVTKVKINGGKKIVDEFVEFDTSNVLFILSGAFVGIEEIIEKRLKKKASIGFNSTLSGIKDDNNVLQNLQSSDVIDFGLIPELVGRVPVITTLNKLTESDLYKILKNVKNSIIDQTQELLRIDDLEIEFSDRYLKTLARLAIKSKLGARSLKGLLENSVFSCMYRIKELKQKDIKTIRFDEYPTDPDKYPVLIDINNKEMTDTNYKLYRGVSEI